LVLAIASLSFVALALVVGVWVLGLDVLHWFGWLVVVGLLSLLLLS
jgi:hypothetical protein